MTDIKFPEDFYLDDVGVWRLKKEKIAELEKPKTPTNFDRITENPEALAMFLERFGKYSGVCEFIGGCYKCPLERCLDIEHSDAKVWLWWLDQESE